MADNKALGAAKEAKQDEFYTNYEDIQKEMNAYIEYNPDTFKDKTILLPCDDPEWSNFTRFFAQNFENFGLKKLISTSYAASSKAAKYNQPLEKYHQISLFELNSPNYDESKTDYRGKIFILDRDKNSSGNIDIDDLEWQYLEGDGDFMSKEVTKLRDEADIIITNPPFSLFRAFLSWIFDANKDCCIIGNQNAIAYKEVFPHIQANRLWLGCTIHSGDREFRVPDDYPLNAASSRIDEDGNKYIRVKGVRWFTTLEHGRRHQPLQLMSKADNLKFSKHKEVIANGYPQYENYDAIEVPFTDAIPGDEMGAMGVPITFMDKYCPEQFEIIGMAHGDLGVALGLKPYPRELKPLNKGLRDGDLYYMKDGMPILPYRRLLIKRKEH